MKRFYSFLVPVLMLILFLSYCGKKEEIVAKVGNLDITKSQFLKEMIKNHGEKPNYQDIDLDRKKNILNGMIKRKMRLLEAYANDLEDDEEIESAIGIYRKRLIANNYYEQVIVNRLVSQKEMDEYLLRQGVELKTSHILIGFKSSNVAKERSREEAKLLAEQVVQEAQSGKDFAELVSKYSDDPSAKNPKGTSQYFKWGERPPPIQEVAWKMKIGEISDAVETQYGFFIIRLEDRRELPNYKSDMSQENIMRVKRTLFQARGDSGRIVADKQLNELIEKYHVEIDTAGIKDLATLLTDKIRNEVVTAESFSPQQKKIVLAKWKGGTMTWQSILDVYGDRLARVIGRFRQANLLRQEVYNLTNLEIVVKDAEKYDIPEDAEIKKQISSFLEDRLTQIIEKREVTDKTTIGDEDIRKYYEASPNKFMKDEELELWQIFVKDAKLAKTIAAKARSGSDFAALAKKYSEDKSSATKGGYAGFRSANSLGAIGQEAFKLGPNKIGGPTQNRSGWMIFKTGKKNEKILKPLKDVENQVRSMLRTEQIKANRVVWEQNLEKKYKVSIIEDVLKQI